VFQASIRRNSYSGETPKIIAEDASVGRPRKTSLALIAGELQKRLASSLTRMFLIELPEFLKESSKFLRTWIS